MNLPLAAVIGGVALALYFLPRRAPALGLLAGLSLLGLAGYMATHFDRGAFQTEGSPAGTGMFVLYLSFGLLAVAAGLYLVLACALRLLRGEPTTAAGDRVAPISRPVLPPRLDECKIWLTPEACAAGAVAQARDLEARSRRAILVPQNARYEALIGQTDAAPVVAARDLRIRHLRSLASGTAHIDLLTIGLLGDTRNEALVLGLLAGGSQKVTPIRHLSLEDLERGGLRVGRTRTAASALEWRADRPLDHPMLHEAIARAANDVPG